MVGPTRVLNDVLSGQKPRKLDVSVFYTDQAERRRNALAERLCDRYRAMFAPGTADSDVEIGFTLKLIFRDEEEK